MSPLEQLAVRALDRTVPPAISAMAAHLNAGRRGVVAILAYGSSLRGASFADTLIDLYMLVDRDEDVARGPLSRLAVRLLPPNVYYAEHAWDGHVLRCKYAVMTLAAFAREMQRDAACPYFWARFSQPAAIIYSANDAARHTVISAVAAAIETMYRAARASAPPAGDPLVVWEQGFTQTYRTELRPETGSRAAEIVAANADFYREAARLLATAEPFDVDWSRARRVGKLLSFLRLAKAALTFEGGAEYAAWKIERHTGKKIAVTDWQRRHPFLAGLVMLPKLLRLRVLR